MLKQHQTRLISTYTAILQHLAEIRQVATTGKAPSGGLVTPLPEPMRRELLTALDEVAANLDTVLSSAIPDWQQKMKDTAGLASTRMWINLLLRTIEDLVKDAQPSRLGKQYGELSQTMSKKLQGGVDDVLLSLEGAKRILPS